ETPAKMAKRLKLDRKYLEDILPIMSEKGQIIHYEKEKGMKYGLMPFVVGIYEEQLDRMDAEFSELMEEYFVKTKYSELFGNKPEIFRIVPVNKVIDTTLAIHPYQDAEKIVRSAKSWGVRECICKKQKELLDEKCNYSKNVCLTFSSRENVYDETTISKPITMEESLELLKNAENEGLVHSSMNVATRHNYICNCCTCCCGVLRGLVQWDQPNTLVKSNYKIVVSEDDCIACANCEDRCQFGAIEVDDVCVIDDKMCVGCGVCAITCDEGALKLIDRDNVSKPPKNLVTWMFRKAWKRRVNPLRLFL
ncbi:MAG: ATP-binding protein, partial [Candidatus Kariarchaeaceae archaeon]